VAGLKQLWYIETYCSKANLGSSSQDFCQKFAGNEDASEFAIVGVIDPLDWVNWTIAASIYNELTN
jgi:hypothetical protein